MKRLIWLMLLLALAGYAIWHFFFRLEVDHSKWYGVHYHATWNSVEDCNNLQLAEGLGAEIVRIGPSWRLLEPTQGTYDMNWYVPAVDALVICASELGMDIVMMMGDAPCWASADPEKDCTAGKFDNWCPVGAEDRYAEAMAFLASRYGNQVVAYEVWNEPNLPFFWCNAPNARQYTELLANTYSRVKEVKPDAVVLGGSLAGADIIFLKQMYLFGANEYYTALAIHPYSGVLPPAACANARWAFECGVDLVRKTMLEQGDNSTIWFTEMGWSSYSGDGGVSERDQAKYFRQALDILSDWSYVPVVIWYDLVEDPSKSDREGFFGLLNLELTPKPAANAFPKDPNG